MICWKCGKETGLEKVFRDTECPLCHADLRCCKGCKFYAPGNHLDCRETVSELVNDKEKSNFCDYFSVCEKVLKQGNESDKARKAAAGLFGDEIKFSSQDSESAKKAFNSLFGD